jgi:hypothetical protein
LKQRVERRGQLGVATVTTADPGVAERAVVESHGAARDGHLSEVEARAVPPCPSADHDEASLGAA